MAATAAKMPAARKLARGGMVSVLALLCLLSSQARGQSIDPPKPDDSEDFTFVNEQFVKVLPNRLMETRYTSRLKVLKEAGTRRVGQQGFPVIESQETVEIEAFVEKADGQIIKVPPSNILSQEINAGLAGIYQPDAKTKVVVFPNLKVGDTTVVTVKTIEKATAFEGQFTGISLFNINGSSGETSYTIEYPKDIGLKLVTTGDGIRQEPATEDGAVRRRKFFYRQPYNRGEPGELSPFDWAPRVAASTFERYEDLGKAYGKMAWPKVAVTPEIRALAEEITAGKADARQKALAVDNWVKSNIRYVAIYRAFARIIPNDAETVLHNRYGDCKDAVTLSAALLAAVGIKSEIVLINSGSSYTLQGVPVVGEFNHVILYIPELDIYTDPTYATAAFGILSPVTSGKPVIRIASAERAVVAHTPLMRAEDHLHTYKLDLKVSADGKVSGVTEETGTGTTGALMRSIAAALRGDGLEASASNRLTGMNNPGRGSYLPEDEKNLSDPYRVRGTLNLYEPMTVPPRITEPLREGMPLLAKAPYMYFGARWPDRKRDFICTDGRDITEINVTFDPGLPMPAVYSPVTVVNEFFRFKTTFAAEGRTYKIRRFFETLKKSEVCGADQEGKLASDLQKAINASNIMLKFQGR